jgi:hypothetical protein
MDLYDGAIFGMLKDFATCDGIQTLTQGGFIWYKFKWQIIPQQLPVLPIKGRTAVYNRMQNLCNAGMLISHPENQKNRESWYRFGPNSSKYSVHFGEHDVHDGEHKNGKNSQKDRNKVHNGEHYVHDGEQSSVHIGEHSSVHNGEHDNTTINNTTINNIDISKKIEGILPSIPQDWPKALKSAVVEYLAYRQELPKTDRIKSQRSWNAKTKSFTKLLAQHGEKDTVGAILLSIANAWKKVSMEWYLKEQPKTNSLVIDAEEDTTTLSEKLEVQFQKGQKDFNAKFNGRILYFSRSEFLTWLPNGANFEKQRHKLVPDQIYKKIKDMILVLHTSTFYKNSTGHLHDFVVRAFQGKIRELA